MAAVDFSNITVPAFEITDEQHAALVARINAGRSYIARSATLTDAYPHVEFSEKFIDRDDALAIARDFAITRSLVSHDGLAFAFVDVEEYGVPGSVPRPHLTITAMDGRII